MRILFIFFVLSFMQIQTLHTDSNENVPIKNELFRHVKASEKNGVYEVKGEIRSNKKEFYYIVEDGHNELITEKRQKVNTTSSKWSKFSFEVVLPKESMPKNGTVILYLFEKDSQGKQLHISPIVLD
ncbi:Gmad2 immunoglobulin-like domain-containing protein [Cytobacillus sp.]|uniref:Gmad2 immunoglobulin-like domain-containing protein n=1 Tax=Cytobacillus sp. TaxID=2675269 RepID=UPI0028BEEE56|nr:Gmad2 immunoglobulin-like domain-containing protein [Cytobacillus sp.]